MCLQNLVSFCQFVLKILSKNQILTSNKGRNSVANLRKTMIYNTNVEYRSAVSVIRVHSVSFVFDDFSKEVSILQNIDASYS